VATVVAGEPIYPAVVKIDPTYISKILGFEISNADVARILRLIGWNYGWAFIGDHSNND